MTKYSLGIDFGTLSARAVLIDIATGNELFSFVSEYQHKVIEDYLPGTSIALENNWALQNPEDYIQSLIEVTKPLGNLPIDISNIIGIGIDFTSCTVMPVKNDGTPLCMIEKWKNNPHAWVKLWKHHAAQPQADKINQLALETNEYWLPFYGEKISSEWLFPKLLQILEEDYEIYNNMDKFIEAGDWLVWKLTGNEKRSLTQAGYKAMYDTEVGFPSREFFKTLNPLFENVVEDKLDNKYYAATECAGYLTEEFAYLTGLKKGTPIAIANIDAHVAVASTGVIYPGSMLSVVGTSSCDIVLSDQKNSVSGVSGVVKNGAGTGHFAYESGQNAVGDIFQWFIDEMVPMKYYQEATERECSIYQFLEEKAKKINPGKSGLLCLDWHNGSRSILMDTNLSGMILGMTLKTKPEEIYRSLIEATAFSKRQTIEMYEKNNIIIDKLVFTGGLAYKNHLLNQIYADITGKEIHVSKYLQTPAIGSAIFGAVAAGKSHGGFADLQEAQRIIEIPSKIFYPDSNSHNVYNELYKLFLGVHDYFGKGSNNIMKELIRIRNVTT